MQSRETLREADKTLRSSRGKLGATRRLGGDGMSTKTKMKIKEIVSSQQDGVGPRYLEGTFALECARASQKRMGRIQAHSSLHAHPTHTIKLKVKE